MKWNCIELLEWNEITGFSGIEWYGLKYILVEGVCVGRNMELNELEWIESIIRYGGIWNDMIWNGK